MAQVEALASVLTLEQMSDYFGIARNTFNAICERQPEVLEHYKRGKTRAIGNVAKNLLTLANEGNLTAIIFYLKTQAGWRETTDINANVNTVVTSLHELLDEIENES